MENEKNMTKIEKWKNEGEYLNGNILIGEKYEEKNNIIFGKEYCDNKILLFEGNIKIKKETEKEKNMISVKAH